MAKDETAQDKLEKATAVSDEPGGNGNGQGLTRKVLENMLTSTGMQPSLAVELLHPGKTAHEMLANCYFKDDKERNAALEYLSLCIEYDDKQGQDDLLRRLAGSVSVKGYSRDQFVTATIGERYKYGKSGFNKPDDAHKAGL